MNSSIERLLNLRVRDLMNKDVVTLDEDATMAEAAIVFDKYDITGAPVVNPAGACVGVLSVSDFAHREMELSSDGQCFGFGFDKMLVKDTGQPLQLDAVKGAQISEHMSPLVQTINQDAPILNAARVLVKEHIHRLVIVDQDQRPIGVMSSLDLAACMIAAIEE